MSKFCEQCPARGDASGKLVTAMHIGRATRKLPFGGEIRLGPYGVLIDEDRNPSVLLHFPDNPGRVVSRQMLELTMFRRLSRKVDQCPGPITERRGMPWNRHDAVIGCAALDGLVVDQSNPYRWQALNAARPLVQEAAQHLDIPQPDESLEPLEQPPLPCAPEAQER